MVRIFEYVYGMKRRMQKCSKQYSSKSILRKNPVTNDKRGVGSIPA